MDFLSILSSVSKIAIIAFILTFVIVLYELYVFYKSQKKEKIVDVPAFTDTLTSPLNKKFSSVVVPKATYQYKNYSPLLYIGGISFLILFIVLSVFLYYRNKVEVNQEDLYQELHVVDSRPSIAVVTPTIAQTSFLTDGEQSFGQGEAITITPETSPTSIISPTMTVFPTVYQLSPSLTQINISISPTQYKISPTISKKTELPKTGNINPSIFIILISVFLIAAAFVI